MNRDEIRSKVRENLRRDHLTDTDLDVRVQADPYGGWNVAVISASFDGLSVEKRRTLAFRGLDGLELEWAELLTPDEAQWAGPLPGEIPAEDLPLWAESLGRLVEPERASQPLPSDLDDDLDPPIVATFYSLRGGVGRSTALAYTARILDRNHRKVVCVDMDLEAPALPVLLGCDDKVREGSGVVDILIAIDQGDDVDLSSHLIPAANGDNLFVLPAGKISANYARKLGLIDPGAWYREERNPLRELLLGLRTRLPFTPDAILLDARTGLSDVSGPLLFDLADLAVIVFFPHPQAEIGTQLLAHSLLNATTWRNQKNLPDKLLPEIRFLVSPTPMSKSKDVIRRYKSRPLRWIEGWLGAFNRRREENRATPIDPEEITHFVSYREDVATSDRVHSDEDIWRVYEPVAEWVERFVASPRENRSQDATARLKETILNELSFSTGTAEHQVSLLEDFVQTDRVEQAMSPDVPLVLGRKGTGKTALFRFLSERDDGHAVVVHAPGPLTGSKRWMLSPDGFEAIDEAIGAAPLKWRHFWTLYLAVAVENETPTAELKGDRRSLRPRALQQMALLSETDVIDAFHALANIPRGSLMLRAWVSSLDDRLESHTTVLWDGLDTGFGSRVDERKRRTRSIEGLFGAWMDLGQGFKHLRFKILLRDDIWRQIGFENKSHLYGRSVRLQWSSQATFLKVVLKQAMKSVAFRTHPSLARVSGVPVDDWPDDRLWTAWDVLVGERMKGGQTAYTRNWVWNRLADGNGDHSPRYLLQLFRESVSWEQQEQGKVAYNKTVIRPRALIRSLPTVSAEAIGALAEEFVELTALLDKLRQIARSPFNADALHEHSDHISLTREVGLLTSYEERDDEVLRYKIPDLYLFGLDMKRKGQA